MDTKAVRWGKTDEQRKQEEAEAKRKAREPKKWFAWYPVELEDGSNVWWEEVTVRRTAVLDRWRYSKEAQHG